MTDFYLVRHGNTFQPEEVPVRIGVKTDLPLTETGERQSRALGEWFAGRGIAFGRAYTGALARTRRTAELIIASQHACPPAETADWLTEIDHGEDEGKPDDLVAARVGIAALRAWDERGIAPPGWHVAAEARLAAWRRAFADTRRGNVLLVTSGGAARFALLACAVTTPPSLKLRTGAFGRIVKPPSGDMRIVSWDIRPPPE